MCIKCKHLYGTMFEMDSDGHDEYGLDCEMREGGDNFPYLRRPRGCKDCFVDAHRTKEEIKDLRIDVLKQRRR